MKISSITLNNFKCFDGTHSIDGLADAVTPEQPIILFGGMNGAGKTTIFEAILLCLYGQSNTTLWPSRGAKRENYLSYILSVTNNNAKSRKTHFTKLWIKLDITDVEIGGTQQSFSIKRTWEIEAYKDKVDEKAIEITQDGKPISYFSEDEYELFIRNELIPQEISQFFLFDGEKIQEFVRDEDREFAESFEAVLGISLYKQLKDDLRTTRSRIVTKYNQDKGVRIELNQVEGEILELEREIQENEEQIDQLETRIFELNEEITEIEAYTRRLTSLDVHTKEEYETEKEKLAKRKGVLEERVFRSIQDEMPFVMLSSLSKQLQIQLEQEQALLQAEAAQQEARTKIQSIVIRLFEGQDSKPPLTVEQKFFYTRRLMNILQETFAVNTADKIEIIHKLSSHNIETINRKLGLTKNIIKELPQNLSELQVIESQLSKIRQTEMKAMDNEVRKLYEKRGSLLEQEKLLQKSIEDCKTAILNAQEQITSKKRKQTELEKKATKTEVMKNQIAYCKQLSDTIDKFSHRFRARKVELLETFTLDMLSKLIRKKDFVAKVEIDPNKYFTISLFDTRGRLIDKTKLSAGEKELLAISLIWALSQLTSRSLPIVIDTPLGRLDSQHRANVVTKYFPKASHQVIILSSDEEITGKEYNAVAPYVSKHFLIEEGIDTQSSIIREGYFSINGD